MERRERIGLWVAVGVLAVWLLALTVMTVGEFKAVNSLLRECASGSDGLKPDTSDDDLATDGALPEVDIRGVQINADSVAITVTVRYAGAGDLLYEPPQVVSDAGDVYPITPDSLEEARYAFLDLATRGQVTAELVFTGEVRDEEDLKLVFNPHQNPDDAFVSPRVETMVR
jgi:hypothetical protein